MTAAGILSGEKLSGERERERERESGGGGGLVGVQHYQPVWKML